MDISIANSSGTGVTITEVTIVETNTTIAVSIPPGASMSINLPDRDSCHVGVTYDNRGLKKMVQRPSPVTGGSTVTLIKSHDEEEPHLV